MVSLCCRHTRPQVFHAPAGDRQVLMMRAVFEGENRVKVREYRKPRLVLFFSAIHDMIGGDCRSLMMVRAVFEGENRVKVRERT